MNTAGNHSYVKSWSSWDQKHSHEIFRHTCEEKKLKHIFDATLSINWLEDGVCEDGCRLNISDLFPPSEFIKRDRDLNTDDSTAELQQVCVHCVGGELLTSTVRRWKEYIYDFFNLADTPSIEESEAVDPAVAQTISWGGHRGGQSKVSRVGGVHPSTSTLCLWVIQGPVPLG